MRKPGSVASDTAHELLAQALFKLSQAQGARSICPRRGLRRDEAALYVGLSATKFMELVERGVMPRPKRIDARVVWDVQALDSAFEILPEDSVESEDTWADFK